MSKINQHKGFIIKCDENCKILDIKMNDFLSLSNNEFLTQCVDPVSLSKLLSFFAKLKEEESTIGWELNFKNGSQIDTSYLAGVKEQDYYIVIGSTDIQETRKYFDDLYLVNNQQLNELRLVFKENVKIKEDIKINDNAFNELTKINNEMANLQRELAKNNHKLATLNIELEQKNTELDQFAHIVSHDLKSPLRGIIGLIDIISKEYSKDFEDDLKNMFALITKSATRMDGLIMAILSYARAGKMDTEISTFYLKSMLDEILDSIGAPDEYSFIIPENLPELTCSYVQLSQVLTNLMGNAVKYHHKPEGIIELKIDRQEQGFLRFSVIDDGPGIPEAYHEKVFGAFVTANQKGKSNSTGIGLAIVQKLVEQNGGEVGLTSTVGKGSTFWFTWPENVVSSF